LTGREKEVKIFAGVGVVYAVRACTPLEGQGYYFEGEREKMFG